MIVINSKTIKSQVVCNTTTIDNAMNYIKKQAATSPLAA